MLKRGIGLGLLCVAGHAFSADITVTTTEDIDKADGQCSLREAIQYINLGMPEAGYNDCGGKDIGNTILLKGKSEYKLQTQITVIKPAQIKSTYTNSINNVLGQSNAIIKMVGNQRLFLIDSSLAPKDDTKTTDKITVTFDEITLDGCGTSNCSIDQGGLIYNKDVVVFQNGQLLNGSAQKGGAIYNDGSYSYDKLMASVSLTNTLMKGNKANQGAVIYSIIPYYSVTKSLIRDNEVTGTGAAIFDVEKPFSEDESKNVTVIRTNGIRNSTLFNNKGYVVKVVDGMRINNITMIMNRLGLILNAPYNYAYVTNSILAKNGTLDCKIEAGGDSTHVSNNLHSAGCAGSNSVELGQTQLLAGNTVEGECDISSGGILCPFKTYTGTLLGYFRPRLLGSYLKVTDSPIVNHGTTLSTLIKCESDDQRGKSRLANNEYCDIGAIELKVDPSAISNIGRDIVYGEIAKMSVADQLNDGELVTPEQCKTILGKALDDNGQAWQPGCLKISQTNTVSKGSMTIDQNGQITYVPNGNWHGSDEFKVLVVTSTTRFNDSKDPYIVIPAKVVQSPPKDFEDKKVSTTGSGGGGSFGLFSIVGLLGLVGLRRLKK